ncbi:Crp/Fnr family transcriptional regulator [Geojedonia litorea]|uniref:Crp/Fnr family transcriptional regulator n=1 Tax=Geojedonia litorea TaxID=1268269 RepID=A0ABV9N1F9_9FLAO
MDFAAKLIENIREIVPINSNDEKAIIEHFRLKKLQKKEFLIQRGDISKHMRFIAQGSLRNYYLDSQGKEHILQLGIEGWWINDFYSFFTQTPAKFYVQAVEKTVIMQISRDDLEKLFISIPLMDRYFRLKIQKGYIALQERTIFRMSQTAEERYLEFRSKYRHLEQRFPQYMIASYLGVTPEFLSSVRKKLYDS